MIKQMGWIQVKTIILYWFLFVNLHLSVIPICKWIKTDELENDFYEVWDVNWELQLPVKSLK